VNWFTLGQIVVPVRSEDSRRFLIIDDTGR